jgi:hypothetical protein
MPFMAKPVWCTDFSDANVSDSHRGTFIHECARLANFSSHPSSRRISIAWKVRLISPNPETIAPLASRA